MQQLFFFRPTNVEVLIIPLGSIYQPHFTKLYFVGGGGGVCKKTAQVNHSSAPICVFLKSGLPRRGAAKLKALLRVHLMCLPSSNANYSFPTGVKPLFQSTKAKVNSHRAVSLTS